MKRSIHVPLGIVALLVIALNLEAQSSFGFRGVILALAGWAGLLYFLFLSRWRRLRLIGVLLSLGLLVAPSRFLPPVQRPGPFSDLSKPSAAHGPLGITRVPQPAMDEPNLWANDPLQGVYHPYRLKIKNPWLTATGIVSRVRREPDGDYHVDLLPDPSYRNLVNEVNRVRQGGALVTEIIPADQVRVPIPRKGNHVAITGPYVLDVDHGWMEIHPARYVRQIGLHHAKIDNR